MGTVDHAFTKTLTSSKLFFLRMSHEITKTELLFQYGGADG
jgi:hypothetical protein